MKVPEKVTAQLKKLPAKPGCYIYRSEDGSVLYVGKALVLKNRVRSYFQSSTRHDARIARMVRQVADIETIVVDSELEALVLECNLIKQHRPPYNVRLRDDKSYPYIVMTKERFPRVMFTRKVRKDGSKYFGPYTSAWSVRDTLSLLHKVFPLIPCGKSWSGRDEQRPCLYFHLGQCLAPCAGLAKKEDYDRVLVDVERFLDGKGEILVKSLRERMDAAAESLEFERAAKLRDQIGSIENVLQRQKVLNSEAVDQDVVAVVKDERGAAIQMLYIRNGKLIGQRQFFLDGSKEAAPTEAVGEFVKQYYADAPDVPREVLLPVEIEERGIVETWLRQRKGKAVTITVPQRGDKLKLLEMAATNAEEALAAFHNDIAKQEEWVEKALAELQDELALPTLPQRVEGYDISNIQGTAPVGSMVVTENGEAAKAEYRRFKIRYHPEDPNDFAMMHEVITRRLKAYLDGDEKFAKLPDLIMIDGGKGQLSAALKARDDLGLTVPMVGLAKKMELIFVPELATSPSPPEGQRLPEGEEPIPEGSPKAESQERLQDSIGQEISGEIPSRLTDTADYRYSNSEDKYVYRIVELPLQAPGLLLLRRLRDEAHRFALTYHRKLRDKRFVGSVIEEIPGVGPRRRRLLLRTFGSIEGIRRASVEELAAVPTMTKALAAQVAEYLRET